MGLMETNKSDIALGPVALIYQRSKISPFTRALFFDEMSILSAYFQSESDIYKPLFMLFNHIVWLILLISILLLSITTTFSKSLKSNIFLNNRLVLNYMYFLEV